MGHDLGDPQSFGSRLETWAVKVANSLHLKNISPPDPPPIFREKPWQLRTELKAPEGGVPGKKGRAPALRASPKRCRCHRSP
ncbi:hypothetical protein SBV1_2780006 [Verrucomicrobia bacterium]|nr:hypothetical protein SBV1_2780006 [Verrucomicrobiota bacterium]